MVPDKRKALRKKKQLQKKLCRLFFIFIQPQRRNSLSSAQLKHDFWNNARGKKRQKRHSCCIVAYGFFYIFNGPD